MIQIHDCKLLFSFPAIAAELDALGEAHVAQMLPVLIAEDRETALAQFLEANAFALETPGFKEGARRVVFGLTNQEIEHQLRVQAGLVKGPYSRTKGELSIFFDRAFRIPDDDQSYSILPSFESFHLRGMDAYAGRAPQEWVERGGALMPMYPSEALWVTFDQSYPFAIKIGAGNVNAVSGRPWQEAALHSSPRDYVLAGSQSCVDGFAVGQGDVRQFTGMPHGSRVGSGTLQFQVVPMKVPSYYETQRPCRPQRLADIVWRLIDVPVEYRGPLVNDGDGGCHVGRAERGQIPQKICKDPFAVSDWDLERSILCCVHTCDAWRWRDITGEAPPYAPFTAHDYETARLPWLDDYQDDDAVSEGP